MTGIPPSGSGEARQRRRLHLPKVPFPSAVARIENREMSVLARMEVGDRIIEVIHTRSMSCLWHGPLWDEHKLAFFFAGGGTKRIVLAVESIKPVGRRSVVGRLSSSVPVETALHLTRRPVERNLRCNRLPVRDELGSPSQTPE